MSKCLWPPCDRIIGPVDEDVFGGYCCDAHGALDERDRSMRSCAERLAHLADAMLSTCGRSCRPPPEVVRSWVVTVQALAAALKGRS